MTLKKGEKNCITDVAGVHVGHVTLYEKLNDTDTICTGVTAILPHNRNLFAEKVRAASYVVNGFGKTNGLIQVDELGTIESPIMLTNTFSVGAVMQGTLEYMLKQDETIGDSTSSLNLVVGECNDSHLNSMRLQAVKPEHAIQAIESASTDAAEEGAVGAGKGMVCYQYKGGIGTSSRIVEHEEDSYTFGVLVLSNFGEKEQALFADWNPVTLDTPDGSIMMIVATDAPLYDRQLKRIAKRTAIGLGRTGSMIGNGSGDIAIAFSTANEYAHKKEEKFEGLTHIRDDHPVMNKLFQAVIEATEEAIINSLRAAETTYGRKGRVIEKAPL
ncbi:MAG TPA: P1 family peptidase [Bacillota bacterium]|nr:P1 family peptidase [Bacillota bacterium]